MSTRFSIQWQDQHGNWQHYQTQEHKPSAYRTAQQRARSTRKRHRLVDDRGRILDLIDP